MSQLSVFPIVPYLCECGNEIGQTNQYVLWVGGVRFRKAYFDCPKCLRSIIFFGKELSAYDAGKVSDFLAKVVAE